MPWRFLDWIFTAFVLWGYLVDIVAAIKITGATGGVNVVTGERPSRQEINTFAASGAPYDLFIIALRQLQSTNQTNPLSYFQISGIHGVPEAAWDGVVGPGSSPGYCIHQAAVFPTWHRPYMALYEQAIWNHAQVIARTYPSALRDEYISAASAMRIPYWDWAIHPRLPDAATQPSVTITTPDGQATLSNPLYAYNFLDTLGNEGLSHAPGLPTPVQTVRYWDPDLQQSNQSAASAAISANALNTVTLVYQMFTDPMDYSSFSYRGTNNPGYNIESIHNNIHNYVGGFVSNGGTMTWLQVAAFDPIFYLHHANVDRLFAMWQALNPDSYIIPTQNTVGSYYELPNSWDSGNSSLAPFHSDNGTTLYTSDGVRNTSIFGYTYPELVDWDISATDLAANVRVAINTLYNPDAFDNNSTTTDDITTTHLSPRPRSRSDIASAFRHISFSTARTLHINNLPMSWSIAITLQRYAYPTPFVLDFFMGVSEPNPAFRATAPNLIGSHATLMSGNISAMFLGGAPEGTVQGYVGLSHTLAAGVDRGALGDLSPECVIPVLREMLTWNARGVDGGNIDVAELKGLSIRVSSRKVQPARHGGEFPLYGKVRYWDGVTKGKVGGRERDRLL